MKKITLTAFIIFNLTFNISFAQNIGMNGTGANAHPSALVDIDASPNNNTGFLLPRIPLQAINLAAPITSPATSLLVYNTASASTGTNAVSPGYYYWDGAKWVRFAYNPSGTSATAWNLLGNAGTNPTTNFVGTTDAKSLVFKTNNLEAVRITTVGNVGIGTAIPQQMLHIESNSTNLLHLANTTSSYSVPAWSNFIRFSDGTTMAGYVGDGSSSNRLSLVGHLENEVSIASFSTSASASENSGIVLSNTTNSQPRSILFRTANTQRAIIDDIGNMGIGTTTPTEKLQVQGSVRIVDGTQGNGKVLTSDATGVGSWQAPSTSLLLPVTYPFGTSQPNTTFTANATTYTVATFTAPSAGLYMICGVVTLNIVGGNYADNASLGSNAQSFITLIGGGSNASEEHLSEDATKQFTISYLFNLTAGQVVILRIAQNNASTFGFSGLETRVVKF